MILYEVDEYDLRAAGNNSGEARIAGVHDPKPVVEIDDNTLDRNEADRRIAVDAVDRLVGIGGRVSITDLGDGEGHIVTPSRKVYENASVV